MNEIEKTLLSVEKCGVYLTPKDLAEIAEQMGFELPAKSRLFMMKKLFAKADQDKTGEKLMGLIDAKMQNAAAIYDELASLYPNAKNILDKLSKKARGNHG